MANNNVSNPTQDSGNTFHFCLSLLCEPVTDDFITDRVALSVRLPLIVLRDRSIQWLNQVTLVLASLFQGTSPHFRNLPLFPAFMFAFDISAPRSSSPASHSLASLTLLSSHLCTYFLSFVLIWPEGQGDKLITFLC